MLVTVEIVVPPDGVDWRNNPIIDYEWVTTTRRGPTSDQIRRQQRLRREAYEARLRREKAELRAKLEARKQREANAAREARERRERNEMRLKNEQRLAREARERRAANERRLKRLREQAATQKSATQQSTTQPTPTQPATTQPATGPVSMHWNPRLQGVSSDIFRDLSPPHAPRVERQRLRCVTVGPAVAWRGLSYCQDDAQETLDG
jgi:hypothetical protein